MNRLPVLLFALAAASAPSCKAHVHGVRADAELLTIDLTRGLS